MAAKSALQKTTEGRRLGKSPFTQVGELVCAEINHIRKGGRGARSAKPAIAERLFKTRPADKKTTKKSTKTSKKRSRSVTNVLKKGTGSSLSTGALSQKAKSAAERRIAMAQREAALKSIHAKLRERNRVKAA